MRRHKSIVTFSREHHFGLLFCWKIRQGIQKNVPVERIQPYVHYYWNKQLRQHFEEEETVLFTLIQGLPVEQAISEHQQIRHLVSAALRVVPTYGQLRIIADTIDNHIRFEERVLFPHIEKELPENRLAELETRRQLLHPEPDDYPDAFWV